MKPKTRLDAFCDGVLTVCSAADSRTSYGGAINTRAQDLTEVVKLPYDEMTIRTQDAEFADARGVSLTLKVKVPACPALQYGQKIKIGDLLYDITQLDPDKYNSRIFLYLGGERALA